MVLILRHRRRRSQKPMTIALGKGGTQDEEEGLLGIKRDATATEDEEPIATAKLRQGPKRSKSAELEGDIDEGIPVIQANQFRLNIGLLSVCVQMFAYIN